MSDSIGHVTQQPKPTAFRAKFGPEPGHLAAGGNGKINPKCNSWRPQWFEPPGRRGTESTHSRRGRQASTDAACLSRLSSSPGAS
jgi:hypothetical protein